MKKIVKLLPVALALMIAVPAFAEEPETASENATSTLNLTVDKFINITHSASSVETANASFNPSYTTITTDKALTAAFHVINNDPTRKIYLSATAPTSGGNTPALFATDASGNGLSIVLTNNSRQPAASAVTNITGRTGVAKASNPDAIGFTITPAIAPKDGTGAAEPSVSYADNKVTYAIKNGEYDMSYALNTTAIAETFSTHDTDGTYQATITLTTSGT